MIYIIPLNITIDVYANIYTCIYKNYIACKKSINIYLLHNKYYITEYINNYIKNGLLFFFKYRASPYIL